MSRKTGWLLLLLVVLFDPSTLRADEGQGQIRARDFFNVVAPDGADPWVVKHPDGWYYATVTTGQDVTLLRSKTISGLGGGERKVVYQPPPEARNLWAPEIHHLAGQWYIYVASDDGDNANHRMFVLENPAADPFEGRFTLKGMIADPLNDRWAIDATVLRSGEQLYLIWSGWEGTRNVAQNLYIAPMRNPWTLDGPRVLISRPTHPWEKRGGPPSINEGPQVLVKGDRIFIVYSAAGSWTDHYCLGLLSARIGSNLLNPSSWKKHPDPVFESANGVFGPGHCSFVKSPDDREDWIVYHAARQTGAGWSRLLRAQPFAWKADGTPNFAQPASPNQTIPLPGGEPTRLRIEAESATLTGSARLARHPTCSGGEKVGYLDTDDSSATFSVAPGKTGAYLLVVRFGNGTSANARASHRLKVNEGEPRIVSYENNGWDNWSNAFVPIELKAGENQLRFEHCEGFAEIDCIDLIPQP
jgi:GH43 family beta-xylosidase